MHHPANDRKPWEVGDSASLVDIYLENEDLRIRTRILSLAFLKPSPEGMSC